MSPSQRRQRIKERGRSTSELREILIAVWKETPVIPRKGHPGFRGRRLSMVVERLVRGARIRRRSGRQAVDEFPLRRGRLQEQHRVADLRESSKCAAPERGI